MGPLSEDLTLLKDFLVGFRTGSLCGPDLMKMTAKD